MWVWEGFYLEDPCELTFANTLLLSNAAISLGNAFINLEISSEYIIFFTLWSFFLSSLFISLQIKEFRILALSINDSLYSSLFFFLTGLHFFHLSIGLILLIYFWCSRSSFTSRYLRSLPSHVIHSVHSAEPVRRTEVNGGEWHAHERREQRTEASGLLTALTSVPWSSCSVHRVSFPPSLRPPSHSIRLRHVVESERSEHGTE